MGLLSGAGTFGETLRQIIDDLPDFGLRQLHAVGHHGFHHSLPARFVTARHRDDVKCMTLAAFIDYYGPRLALRQVLRQDAASAEQSAMRTDFPGIQKRMSMTWRERNGDTS